VYSGQSQDIETGYFNLGLLAHFNSFRIKCSLNIRAGTVQTWEDNDILCLKGNS